MENRHHAWREVHDPLSWLRAARTVLNQGAGLEAVAIIPVVRDLVQARWCARLLAWRWHLRSGGQPHRLPGQLIVSLTSYPPRFGTLVHTLRSLLLQTVKADRTILWIAHGDLPLLPADVVGMQAAGLEIRATDDLRSYKKIIPALDAFPDAFICTADDDQYYRPSWLEELIAGAGGDRVVTCRRAHEITFNSHGAFNPYNQWVLDTRRRGTMRALFPNGAGGVLYPPGVLAHTAEDRAATMSLCPSGDDIWLYWIGRRNGATYRTTPRWRRLIEWPGSQDVALWRRNMLQGVNDQQIRSMAQRYGYPGSPPRRPPQAAVA